MQKHPSPATTPPLISTRQLQERYGARWALAADEARGLWSAEFRSPDGRHRRYIVAMSADDMDHKLQAADRTES